MLYKVYSNSNHYLFSELSSVSTTVRHTRTAAAAHPLEFEVSRCKVFSVAQVPVGLRKEFINNFVFPTYGPVLLVLIMIIIIIIKKNMTGFGLFNAVETQHDNVLQLPNYYYYYYYY